MLSILGCGKKPEKAAHEVINNNIEKEVLVQEKASIEVKKEPKLEIYHPKNIDSLKINEINSYQDSLLKVRDSFYLIEKDHQDFECFKTDSIYFTEKKNIILNISRFGCLDEESLVTKVYSENELVYFSETKLGDLIMLEKKVIYFNERKPILITNYEYDVDWTNRVIIDSTTKYLKPENLKKLQYQSDSFTATIFSEIDSLQDYRSNTSDSLVIYKDTVSYEQSSITYIMDSISYNKLVK